MTDLLHEVTPPLAFNEEGEPFVPPPEAIAWRVRRFTGGPGRPPVVWVAHGPLHLGLETTMAQLRIALNNKCGSYRLYAIDKAGREIGTVSAVEVVPESPDTNPAQPLAVADRAAASTTSVGFDVETARMCAQVPGMFFELFKEMMNSRNAHDEVMSGLLKTLVTSTANIQQSTAGLLNTANTTVKVANGVEAIERADVPALDLDDLAGKVETLEKLRDLFGQGSKPEMPWLVHLLNGPGGMALMTMANKLGQAASAGQAAGAQGSTQSAKQSKADED